MIKLCIEILHEFFFLYFRHDADSKFICTSNQCIYDYDNKLISYEIVCSIKQHDERFLNSKNNWKCSFKLKMAADTLALKIMWIDCGVTIIYLYILYILYILFQAQHIESQNKEEFEKLHQFLRVEESDN